MTFRLISATRKSPIHNLTYLFFFKFIYLSERGMGGGTEGERES